MAPAPTLADYRQVAPADLRIVHNYRRSLGDISGLTESIRKHGVLQAAVAREVGDGLELVIGHRRRDAALAAGVATIPVQVRELADDQVLDLQVAENLEREDVSPMDEAEAFGALLDRGDTLAEIAERFGRSAAWIARRAQLRRLSDEAAEWLAEGRLPIRHAAALSQYETSDQDSFLHRLFGEVGSLGGFRRDLAHAFERRIKDAPFAFEDAELVPDAGACMACPHRTSVQPQLFEDEDEDGDYETQERCLRPACWNAKIAAHEDQLIASIAHRHGVETIRTLTPEDRAVSVYAEKAETWSGPYVALGNRVVAGGKNKTWRSTLSATRRPKPDAVYRSTGRVIPLWKPATLVAAAKKHGIVATTGRAASTDEKEQKRRIETARWRKVADRLFAALPQLLAETGLTTAEEDFARLLAQLAVDRAPNEACKAAARRLGLERKMLSVAWKQHESWTETIRRRIPALDAAGAVALVLEVLAWGYGPSTVSGLDTLPAEVAAAVGFDVSAARRAVLAAEKKPKKTKAKKPRKNRWARMTPEEKRARVKKMIAGGKHHLAKEAAS